MWGWNGVVSLCSGESVINLMAVDRIMVCENGSLVERVCSCNERYFTFSAEVGNTEHSLFISFIPNY